MHVTNTKNQAPFLVKHDQIVYGDTIDCPLLFSLQCFVDEFFLDLIISHDNNKENKNNSGYGATLVAKAFLFDLANTCFIQQCQMTTHTHLTDCMKRGKFVGENIKIMLTIIIMYASIQTIVNDINRNNISKNTVSKNNVSKNTSGDVNKNNNSNNSENSSDNKNRNNRNDSNSKNINTFDVKEGSEGSDVFIYSIIETGWLEDKTS